MATQRYISTSFWDDEWVQTLDPSEKLLFLYYMTSPATNIAGVYKITIRRVSFDTGFNLDTISHIMAKFEKAKKVFRIGEYIALPNWPKHQKWQENEKIKTGIDAILSALPESVLNALAQIGYAYPIDSLSISHQYPTNYLNSDSNSDINSDSDLLRGAHKAPPSDNPEQGEPVQSSPSPPKRFTKPTLEEVRAYCAERRNTVSPEKFLDYYEANGWRVGRNPMKDWRAAVRNWEQNEKAGGKNASRPTGRKDPWDEPGYYENSGMREARGV